MRKTHFPTLIAVVFLLVGLATGVVLVQYNQEYRTSASTDTNPKNVRIVNINSNSFAVTWTTDKKTDGFVKYSKGGLSSNVAIDKFQKSFTHFVEVKNLEESQKYSFQIGSGSEVYDNNGIKWIVETPTSSNSPSPNTITGKVLNKNNEPLSGALVYITAGSSSVISTTTSEKGIWVVNLSDLRTSNLVSFQETPPNTILEISVQAGTFGTSSAKILAREAYPVPNITIGSSHDFRNIEKPIIENLPSASLGLPEASTEESEVSN